jgi:hypothetical protein
MKGCDGMIPDIYFIRNGKEKSRRSLPRLIKGGDFKVKNPRPSL